MVHLSWNQVNIILLTTGLLLCGQVVVRVRDEVVIEER